MGSQKGLIMKLRDIVLLEKSKSKPKSNFETLKKNKVALTDEEREMVMKGKATWHHGLNGKPSPAVWKSKCPKTGCYTYVCNTHRSFSTSSTCKGAIGKYHSHVKGTA